MNKLLERALQERKRLVAELDVLDKFIHSLRDIPEQFGEGTKSAQLGLFTGPKPMRADESAAVAAMLDEAARLMVEQGKPLSRSTLVTHLEQNGHRLKGGDKSKVLGTNLWRSGRFLNLKGFGYWPKNTPVPERYRDAEERTTIVPKQR